MRVDDGGTRIAARNVVGGDVVEDGILVVLALGGGKVRRQVERRLAGRPVIEPLHVGERRDRRTIIGPAGDLAVGYARREGGVGIDRGAVDGELRPGDLFGGDARRPGDPGFEFGAQPARVVVDPQRILDHRIVRRLDGLEPAVPQGLAHLGIVEVSAADQSRRQPFRAFLAQQGVGQRRIDGQVFARLGQALLQDHLFLRLVGRRDRAQFVLQRGQA